MNEKPRGPNYFTGAGIHPITGHEEAAKPIIKKFAEMGFDPDATPWIMQELVFDGDATDAQRAVVRQSLQLHIGMSGLHVPIPEDPDIKPTEAFPITFCLGPNPSEEGCLLLGTTNQKFVDAWERFGMCYYEVHCWNIGSDKKDARGLFFSTVVSRKHAPLRLLWEMPKPIIIPIDAGRGYRCIYAEMQGL